MSALFRRRKTEPPRPPEPPPEPAGLGAFDGSKTTYITGNKERDTDRVRLLIDSLRTVSSKTDADELLRSMVDRAVRVVGAERGLLFTTDESGKLVLRVARNASAEDLKPSSVTWSRQTVQGVVDTGESVCKREDDGGEFDPSQSMINLNIRALMCVPLVFREKRQGALYVDARASERRFAKGDLRFFEAFADMLSIVWTNRRIVEERMASLRMQRDLELVREIQSSLIPEAPLRAQGFTLCGRVIPATEAGGDAFDFFRTKRGRLVVTVGDVSGHGAGPALYMAGARAYLRSLCNDRAEPAEVLTELNRHLVEDMGDDMFMSLFLGVLDPETRRFSWANGGHPAPVLVRADGRVEDCGLTGMALGVEADVCWGERSVEAVEPGDTVVMVTDGVLELRQGDEQYGRERLAAAVVEHRGLEADALVERLVADALAWSGREAADDDVTVAVVRAETS